MPDDIVLETEGVELSAVDSDIAICNLALLKMRERRQLHHGVR